jgi:hypothetical protein
MRRFYIDCNALRQHLVDQSDHSGAAPTVCRTVNQTIVSQIGEILEIKERAIVWTSTKSHQTVDRRSGQARMNHPATDQLLSWHPKGL